MRTGLKILTFLWMVFWFALGILLFLVTPKQIEKDRGFIKTILEPPVDFVKQFRKSNGRLPTYREYYSWHKEIYPRSTCDLNQQVDSLIAPKFSIKPYIRKLTDIESEDQHKFQNVDWNNNFAIAEVNGRDWMIVYYHSWTDTYDFNNYTWKDGSIKLF